MLTRSEILICLAVTDIGEHKMQHWPRIGNTSAHISQTPISNLCRIFDCAIFFCPSDKISGAFGTIRAHKSKGALRKAKRSRWHFSIFWNGRSSIKLHFHSFVSISARNGKERSPTRKIVINGRRAAKEKWSGVMELKWAWKALVFFFETVFVSATCLSPGHGFRRPLMDSRQFSTTT